MTEIKNISIDLITINKDNKRLGVSVNSVVDCQIQFKVVNDFTVSGFDEQIKRFNRSVKDVCEAYLTLNSTGRTFIVTRHSKVLKRDNFIFDYKVNITFNPNEKIVRLLKYQLNKLCDEIKQIN